MLIYTYKLGKMLYNRETGILSTFFVISVPIVAAFSRTFVYKFMDIALLPAIVYYLLNSKGFTDSRNTIIFLVLSVIGVLVRENLFIYISMITTIYIFMNLKKGKDTRSFLEITSALASLFVSITTLVILLLPRRFLEFLCHPSYAHNLKLCLQQIILEPVEILSVSSFYIRQLLPLLIIITINSLVYFIYKTHKEPSFEKILTLLWLILPILIYPTFFYFPTTIHITPIIIPLGFITGFSTTKLLKFLKTRNILSGNKIIYIVLGIFILNFVFYSYNYTPYVNQETYHGRLNRELRYYPSNDYKETFEEIGKHRNPKVGRIFLKETEGVQCLWPVYRDNYQERFLNLRGTGFIPENTRFLDIYDQETRNIASDIEETDVIAVIHKGINLGQLYYINNYLEEDWEIIETVEPDYGHIQIVFYRPRD